MLLTTAAGAFGPAIIRAALIGSAAPMMNTKVTIPHSTAMPPRSLRTMYRVMW